jgi:hypothetical protein
MSIACLPVLTGRLIPAHGETVGNIPHATHCVPTGRFIGELRQRTMGDAVRVRLRKKGIIVEETDLWDAADNLRPIPTSRPLNTARPCSASFSSCCRMTDEWTVSNELPLIKTRVTPCES